MLNLLENIHFEQPIWLWVLPLSLVLLISAIVYRSKYLHSWSGLYEAQRHLYYRHPLSRLLQVADKESSQKSGSSVLKKTVAYGVLAALFHIALAQPYHTGERLPDPPEYRDIVFVVDTSVSMSLRDYTVAGKRIDRMSMVKSVLQHFISGLSGSRIGVVIFSEDAYLLVPLTTDHDLVRHQLQRMQAANLTGRRTDTGHALVYALGAIESYMEAGGKPVFVMLTDANQPVGNIDPMAAASLIHDNDLTLHTIAMGAGSQAAKERSESRGLYEAVDFNMLEEIAHNGGGDFFLTDSHESLNAALDKIRQAEKRESKTEPLFIKIPLYYWPIGFALIWIVLLQLIPILRLGK